MPEPLPTVQRRGHERSPHSGGGARDTPQHGLGCARATREYLAARFVDYPHSWLTALFDEEVALGYPRGLPFIVAGAQPLTAGSSP